MTLLRVLVAGMLLAGPAAAEVCEIRGQDVILRHAEVRPPGAAPFAIDFVDVPLVARVTGTEVRLELSAAVELTAYAKPGVWYAVTSDVADGQVRLSPGARIIGQHAKGGVLVGSAVFYAQDVIEGELSPAVDQVVERVRVACDRLSLDWSDGGAGSVVQGDGTSWETRRGSTLRLFASPTTRARSVTLRASSCDEACFTVERIERKGGWFKVVASNETSVVGWVPARTLSRLPATGVGHATGCFGRHDTGRIDGAPRVPAPVPARLARGTILHARPGVGPIGKVLVEDGYRVVHAPGDAWAAVTSIPGVKLHWQDLWVPAAALLPPTP